MVFVKGQTSIMKGRHHSKESREKMSLAKKGKPSLRKGTHLSEESKNKIRIARARQGSNVWNKGRRTGSEMPCDYCGKLKYYNSYKISHNKTRKFFCSSLHQILFRTEHNNPAWKGDQVGYYAVHRWLDKNYGKPNDCEQCGTTIAKLYDWANKFPFKYKRLRSDWLRLCRDCHIKYDKKYGHDTRSVEFNVINGKVYKRKVIY